MISTETRRALGLERPPAPPRKPLGGPRNRNSRKVLLYQVALTFGRPFAMEELVVAAWERHPEEFGLCGFPHPCSNKVISELCGQRGLVGLGYLRRTMPRTYVAVTEQREAVAS